MEQTFIIAWLGSVVLFVIVQVVAICSLSKCKSCDKMFTFKNPPNKNPYRRICNSCGRQEDWHEYSDGQGQWEVMNRSN